MVCDARLSSGKFELLWIHLLCGDKAEAKASVVLMVSPVYPPFTVSTSPFLPPSWSLHPATLGIPGRLRFLWVCTLLPRPH